MSKSISDWQAQRKIYIRATSYSGQRTQRYAVITRQNNESLNSNNNEAPDIIIDNENRRAIKLHAIRSSKY